MNRSSQCRPGFTIVELLLYGGLTAVLTIGLMRSMIALLERDKVIDSRLAVQQQLRVALERIGHDIREAQSVDVVASTFENDAGALILLSGDLDRDPIEFRLVTDRILVRFAEGEWHPLTGDRLIVTQLRFVRATPTDTPSTIRMTVTASDAFAADGTLVADPVTMVSAATVRRQFGVEDPRALYGYGADFYQVGALDLLFGLGDE